MPALRLSALGFDVVLALGSAPDGMRLSEIASAIASPPSSVQRVLGTLREAEVVVRSGGRTPLHRLNAAHPAREELVRVAAVLPEPAHALAIVLRSSPAVTFASYDGIGFVVALDDRRTEAIAALDTQLGAVAGARLTTPDVLRVAADELSHLLEIMPGLRMRVRAGLLVKGRAPAGAMGPATKGSAQADRSKAG
jgi:hypothetical protein